MSVFLVTVVTLACVTSILSIHPLVGLLVKLLGEENCISTDSVNGCNLWPFSVIVSTCLAAFLWGRWGWAAMAAVPVGPVCMSLACALSLRFGEPGARRKEFAFDVGGVVGKGAGTALGPAYFVGSAGYSCTGPASGYCLYGIALKGPGGTIATNGYVSRSEYERHVRRLVDELAVRTLDVTFVVRAPDASLRSVAVGGEWNDLVLGPGSGLPPEEREWWGRLTRPVLGPEEIVEIGADELLRRLAVVEAAAAQFPLVKQRVTALRNLAGSSATVQAMPGDFYSFTYTKRRVGERTSLRFEDGVAVTNRWSR